MLRITVPPFTLDENRSNAQQTRFRSNQLDDPLTQAQNLQQRRTKPPQRIPGAMAVTVAIPLTGELEQGACLLG
jgi:hypothetical protein